MGRPPSCSCFCTSGSSVSSSGSSASQGGSVEVSGCHCIAEHPINYKFSLSGLSDMETFVQHWAGFPGIGPSSGCSGITGNGVDALSQLNGTHVISTNLNQTITMDCTWTKPARVGGGGYAYQWVAYPGSTACILDLSVVPHVKQTMPIDSIWYASLHQTAPDPFNSPVVRLTLHIGTVWFVKLSPDPQSYLFSKYDPYQINESGQYVSVGGNFVNYIGEFIDLAGGGLAKIDCMQTRTLNLDMPSVEEYPLLYGGLFPSWPLTVDIQVA